MTIEIDESQRQAILVALARLAIERPGWKYMLGETAKTMDNVVDDRPQTFDKLWAMRHEEVRDSLPEEPTGESLNKALAKHDPPTGRTIADAIAEYKATRNTAAVKLLHRVLDKLVGLKCPHCREAVSVVLD